MSVDEKVIAPILTPSLVYDDPREGIRWLVDVLGFREASRYESPDGGVAFAELVWRTGVVFVSGRRPSSNPWSKVGLASIALAAEDGQVVDRLYERAVAAGADIVRPVHDARTPACSPTAVINSMYVIPKGISGRSGPFSPASRSEMSGKLRKLMVER